ncbi:MAG: DUF3301 domain-containing protein [Wenzhouxiangellaceae bacterium]|nr:DUF3301 domain-containing protein [Wenzhouxiangellaceae bacterium]
MASAIPAMLALAGLLLWWHSSVQALDRARALAGRFCKRQDWQLLDQTVSIASLRPRRTENGWCLVRIYRFEFCPDGSSRLGGGLLMNGARPLRIWADGPDGRVLEEFDYQRSPE